MRRPLVLITDYGAPYIGGMETHAAAFARYFSARHALACVFVLPLTDARADVERFASDAGIGADPPVLALGRESILTADPLERALRAQGIPEHAVLFFNSFYWIRILPELKRRFPRAFIGVRSGGNDALQARVEGEGGTLSARQSFIGAQLRGGVDALIVGSAFSRARMKRIGAPSRRTHVVPGGADTAAFAPASAEEKRALRREMRLPEDRVVFMAAARLVPFKGFTDALEALARLTGMPFLYLIAGDGPQRARLAARAAELGLAGSVRFDGIVPHERMPLYAKAADAYFFMPRLERMDEPGGSYVHTETMGRSVCEAMAAGLPIVATKVGGIPEIVRGGTDGFLVPERDTEAAARSLARLAREPETRERMGRAARTRSAARFGWDALGARYRALLHA